MRPSTSSLAMHFPLCNVQASLIVLRLTHRCMWEEGDKEERKDDDDHYRRGDYVWRFLFLPRVHTWTHCLNKNKRNKTRTETSPFKKREKIQKKNDEGDTQSPCPPTIAGKRRTEAINAKSVRTVSIILGRPDPHLESMF